MRPKNIEQIRKKSLNFGLIFAALVIFTLVPAYFFVWAAGQQKQAFIERLQEYRQVQNKQILLKEKIDSLYIQLSYVNAEKISDYIPLEKSISENKYDIGVLIGSDSSANFKTYAHILKNLNTQVFLKDSIVKMVGQENMLKTDLISYMAKIKGIHKSIFAQTQLSNN